MCTLCVAGFRALMFCRTTILYLLNNPPQFQPSLLLCELGPWLFEALSLLFDTQTSCALVSGFLGGGPGEPAGDPQQAAAAVSVPHGAVRGPHRYCAPLCPFLSPESLEALLGKTMFRDWLEG